MLQTDLLPQSQPGGLVNAVPVRVSVAGSCRPGKGANAIAIQLCSAVMSVQALKDGASCSGLGRLWRVAIALPTRITISKTGVSLGAEATSSLPTILSNLIISLIWGLSIGPICFYGSLLIFEPSSRAVSSSLTECWVTTIIKRPEMCCCDRQCNSAVYTS